MVVITDQISAIAFHAYSAAVLIMRVIFELLYLPLPNPTPGRSLRMSDFAESVTDSRGIDTKFYHEIRPT